MVEIFGNLLFPRQLPLLQIPPKSTFSIQRDYKQEIENNFAGNMLELEGKDGNGNPHPVIVMSKTAFESLDNEQLYTLQNYATIVAPDLEYIEKNGGGSARCMVAEIF